MTDIVIIGSGFAGCTAVRSLRARGCADPITLVSPAPELFFYPSLIWVPSGQREEADLRIDLEGFFRKHQVKHVAARVQGLDLERRVVRSSAGEHPFADLIIASGGRYLRKLPGIERAHIACAGWEETRAFSDRLASMESGRLAFGFSGNPKEPSGMRGGPIFEFLFGVDTLLRRQGRREAFELSFFSPAPRPGKRMGEKAVDRLLGEMSRRGIQTHLGHKLKGFEDGRVVTEGGEVGADLILFVPGMTGPDWLADSGLPLSDGGFIQADAHCRVVDHEGIYVAGDAGSFPGPEWKPKQAHMADLQAETAVANLLARRLGRPQDETFKTELLCIVDSLSGGSLVYRDPRRALMLKLPGLHWTKVWFEKHYLGRLKVS